MRSVAAAVKVFNLERLTLVADEVFEETLGSEGRGVHLDLLSIEYTIYAA